jgi:hypothetical protein
VSASPGSSANVVDWGSVSGATKYWVFRADGPAGCLFGKTKIAEVTGNTYTDNDVLPGRTYYYNVVAVGASSACFGQASRCVSAAANP